MTGAATGAPRYSELDGLRGVAALVVVLHHSILCYPDAWRSFGDVSARPGSELLLLMMRTPLYLLFSGPAAVMVFFVLSGLVLALTFQDVDRGSYVSYLPKRLARIWLPFATAIAFSTALYLCLAGRRVEGVSDWFTQYSWSRPLTAVAMTEHLLMKGPETWLDNPMWSLVQELRISIVFPVLLFCLVKSPTMTLLLTAALSALVTAVLPLIHSSTISIVVQGFGFLFAFALGAALNRERQRLRQVATLIPPAVVAILVVSGLLLLLVDGPADPVITALPAYLRPLLVAAGAALIVTVALCGRASILATTPVLWLGRISYSLYLIHVPIIVAALHVTGGRHLTATLAFAVLTSLGVAQVMNITVERASQRLGRRVATTLTKLRGRGRPRLAAQSAGDPGP